MNIVLLEEEESFIATFCNNVAESVKAIGSYVILVLGIALIIVSIVQLVKAFVSSRGANWLIIIACLLVGGLLTFGGWRILTNEDLWGALAKNTLENINEGNEAAAIGEYTSGDLHGTADQKARYGLGMLGEMFIVPFGTALAVCVGVILVIMAVYQVAKFFFGNGRAQISWVKVALMCVLGSVLFTGTPTNNDGGWTWVRDKIVGSTRDAIDNMSEGNSDEQNYDGLPGARFGE